MGLWAACGTMTPMEIDYVFGDATDPVGDGPKLIAHVCNDVGAWGRGFVVSLSARWREPEAQYRRWHREAAGRDSFKLGMVQLVPVADGITVANMIGQHGIRSAADVPPIRYNALQACLETVAHRALDLRASVHMPRIGCGLAGGSWDHVEPLIVEELCARGVPVTVYDLA